MMFAGSSHRISRAGSLACLSMAVVLGAMFSAPAASAETAWFVDWSTGQVEKVDTRNPGKHAFSAGPGMVQYKSKALTFDVQYEDVNLGTGYGFDDPVLGPGRQDAVQTVLSYIDGVLNETGACDIKFSASGHGTSMGLVSGGSYFNGVAPLFTNGYAFQHITTGTDPSGAVADIALTFYFDWPWYAGTGTPASDQMDFASVLLHQLTHGLGLVSLSNINGDSIISPFIMSKWDNLLETGNSKKLWDSVTAAFLGRASDLTGGDNGVRFTGSFAGMLYGTKPPVYAPPAFQAVNSLSNWNTGIVGHAVMEPFRNTGEIQRVYAPVDLAALKDIGYTKIITPFTWIDIPMGGWFEIGQRLEMRASAIGTVGTVTYQWRKDGADIPGATTSEYVIDHLALFHGDSYTCVLSDESPASYESPRAVVQVFEVGSLPTMGVIGLSIVAMACVLAGVFIILRKE